MKLLNSILIIFLFGITQVYSQSAVRESFNYPLGTYLDNKGEAKDGWGGPWILFDSSWAKHYNVFIVSDTGFSYNDKINFPIYNTGHHIKGANKTAWGYQRYGRYLAQRWPQKANAIYWLSCAYQLERFTDNGWALVSVYDSTKELAGVGHEWGNDWIGIATYNDEGHSPYMTKDGPQWLVARIKMSGDSTARVHLWVSPDPNGGEPDTNMADARGNWKLPKGFNRIVVHFGGEGVGMTMAVDEIRLGTTWKDVSSPITNVVNEHPFLSYKFELMQNYPNPFNPTTKISYSIDKKTHVKLTIYDLMGNKIATIVDGIRNPGIYITSFNSHGLPSGIYFYKLETENQSITKKMILIK
ncbi:MAG: T9SS type A sorting domain-containing protein [Melioribacter sp.]|nr:T9SS type A sorting domain-containing protein [Melioribacter sp.]